MHEYTLIYCLILPRRPRLLGQARVARLVSAGLERLGMVRAPGTESGNGNVWQ